MHFRYHVQNSDPDHIERIVRSSGFFHDEEIRVAVELAEETLQKGVSAGYSFIFAEEEGAVVGYTCYGLIPCTQSSYDLYWIAVQTDRRGGGVGRKLLEETEEAIRKEGGTRVYIETSSRPQYEPTRYFYLSGGYKIEVILEDFYAPGDGKVIYSKALKAV